MSDFISSTTTLEQSNSAIYPNPSSNQITIELDQADIFEYASIYNNLGQKLITSAHPIINTSSLSPGIYIIEVRTNRGRGSRKLIIQ